MPARRRAPPGSFASPGPAALGRGVASWARGKRPCPGGARTVQGRPRSRPPMPRSFEPRGSGPRTVPVPVAPPDPLRQSEAPSPPPPAPSLLSPSGRPGDLAAAWELPGHGVPPRLAPALRKSGVGTGLFVGRGLVPERWRSPSFPPHKKMIFFSSEGSTGAGTLERVEWRFNAPPMALGGGRWPRAEEPGRARVGCVSEAPLGSAWKALS